MYFLIKDEQLTHVDNLFMILVGEKTLKLVQLKKLIIETYNKSLLADYLFEKQYSVRKNITV